MPHMYGSINNISARLIRIAKLVNGRSSLACPFTDAVPVITRMLRHERKSDNTKRCVYGTYHGIKMDFVHLIVLVELPDIG